MWNGAEVFGSVIFLLNGIDLQRKNKLIQLFFSRLVWFNFSSSEGYALYTPIRKERNCSTDLRIRRTEDPDLINSELISFV